MSKIKKIEDRTIWFIEAYKKLSEGGRLPTNVDLAKIMGIESKSTITNILNKDQNIQPQQWDKFKKHFSIEGFGNGSQKTEREPTTMELLAGLTEGFRAIAETMRSIESKMAQREDQAVIKEKVQTTETRTLIIESNLKLVLETLRTVGVRQEADEEVVLESLARLEGKPEKALFLDAGKRKGRIEKAADIHGKKAV